MNRKITLWHNVKPFIEQDAACHFPSAWQDIEADVGVTSYPMSHDTVALERYVVLPEPASVMFPLSIVPGFPQSIYSKRIHIFEHSRALHFEIKMLAVLEWISMSFFKKKQQKKTYKPYLRKQILYRKFMKFKNKRFYEYITYDSMKINLL